LRFVFALQFYQTILRCLLDTLKLSGKITDSHVSFTVCAVIKSLVILPSYEIIVFTEQQNAL
jgi:hypothetical protein